MKQICVFCGSRPGQHPEFARAAQEIGLLLAQHGLGLVYGGGKSGLMGLVADSCLEAGGHVTGVIPSFMDAYEVTHTDIQDLRTVETMHERKMLMCNLADAFVTLPGGIGTLEELLEQLAWFKLERHQKPIGLLNTEGFYDPFLAMLEHIVEAGFYAREDLEKMAVAAKPQELLNRMNLVQQTTL